MPIQPPPVTWQDLQAQVGLILNECGMDARVNYHLTLAKGQANIDVFARDNSTLPPNVYVCECKHWATAVPQTTVHALQTVVLNSGANLGLIISRSGFQSGAFDAATNSNIRLLTWEVFQQMFAARWVKNYLCPTLMRINEPLVDYTEPNSGKVGNHPMPFNLAKRNAFAALSDKYQPIAFFALALYQQVSTRMGAPLVLPLRTSAHDSGAGLPDDLMDEPLLRPFLNRYIAHIQAGLKEFDAFFGGRI